MKNLSQKILGVIIILAAFVFTATSVLAAQSSLGGGNADGGGGSTGGCEPDYDRWGGCFTKGTGFFWVKIDASSNYMPFSSMHSYSPSDQVGAGGSAYFIYLRKSIRLKAIEDCLTYGGKAYVLVTRMYNSSGNFHGLGAGMMLSEAWDYHIDGQGVNMGVGEGVSWQDAMNTFNANAAALGGSINGYTWTPGSSLTWFCAAYTELSSTTTTTTTTSSGTKWYPDCYGTKTREWGETVSRIAVRNASLDTYIKYSKKGNWRPSAGIRAGSGGTNNDSGWTDSGGEWWTIAKPGDSIQFVHEYCTNARYARRTPTQDSFTGAESHTDRFDIPADRMVISAEPNASFAFGQGIAWMNSETASVTKRGAPQESAPFTNDPHIEGAGLLEPRSTYYGFGIGTLSPTLNVSTYNCNSVAQYKKNDKWMGKGTFQIPGWIGTARSCSSASSVGNKADLVGDKIVQKHTFRRIKAWEQYTSSHKGDCSCDPNGDTASWGGYRFSPDYAKPMTNWGYKRNHDCQLKKANDASCSCWKDIVKDEYGRITSCTHYGSYELTPDSRNQWKYHSTAKNYGDATKTASVFIPYNFLTEVHAYIDAPDIIFQGSAVGSDYKWEINPRKNEYLTKSYVNGGSSLSQYATYTPYDTKIQMIEFIMKPDNPGENSHPDKGSKTATYKNGTIIPKTENPCAYFKDNIYANKCQVLEEIVGPQNPTGDYKGSDGGASRTRTVPDGDEYVGFKYCVAIGIWPSDSHDYQTNTLNRQRTGGFGGAMDAGEYWNISNASCRTITKKPTMQVWNGSVYTEGIIKTSVTKKMLGSDFDNGCETSHKRCGDNYSDSETKIFGSWTDYAIVAGRDGTVKGMSSGAVLGYDNNRYDLSFRALKTTSVDYNKLSALTFANTGDTKGKSGINASPSIDVNLQRLYSRYRDKAATFASKDGGPQKNIRTAETGMQYAYYRGNTSLSSLASHIVGYGKPNYDTLQATPSAIYKKLSTADSKKYDNTLVIYVTGDLLIDRNICLGSACSGGGMTLIEYKTGTETNAANKLPQVLIFANNIKIEQNVTRVDAWLVATSPSGEGGKINTCTDAVGNEFTPGNNIEARDGYQRFASYGNCYKTLIVNGPVYAKKMVLSRTAGAYHGYGKTDSLADPRYRQYGAVGSTEDGHLGSAIPAEIFNLRADVYLWAYNQAQRYSEAVVTYMRELAPRY